MKCNRNRIDDYVRD